MYDFSGYATKNDLECADGRIIRRNAFKENDQTRVPLVWHHLHNDPANVLGHADLENRDDGVYAYCTFNSTQSGQDAKQLVQHGDITAMSIYANHLKQQGPNVIHGTIREVSLVMAGANPGALIDPLSIAHGDGSYTDVEDEAVIYTNETIILHADNDSNDDSKKGGTVANKSNDDATIQDIIDTMNEDQKNVMYYLIGQALEQKKSDSKKDSVSHADTDDSDDDNDDDGNDDDNASKSEDKTIKDVIDSMTKDQKQVMYFLIGQALNDKGKAGADNKVAHGDFGYSMEDDMRHNVFENQNSDVQELSHDEMAAIVSEAQNGSNGSLKNAFLEHGIENIDVLYPEAKLVTPTPELIGRDTSWVTKVWNALKKTPFGRIRSVAANISEYEARARGYVKGTQKVEEVISVLGRSTVPQTVYKIQKIDRDDVIDITDLDIVAWMKREMRTMLDEEIVRAVLVGDDRPTNDPSRINPEHIRPIYQDSDTYTIHENVTIPSSATFNDIADIIIERSVLARKNYMGSGTPVMLASTDVITRMLLAKDTLGHRMYRNESELAAALRVSEIIEVPIFDGVTRTASVSTVTEGTTVTTNETRKLLALIVNLGDYSIGNDRQGAVTLFDDFDLNFNKYEYLIETRVSGALTVPYSAIALETNGDLPFDFGTVSGMYQGSSTQQALAAAAAANNDQGGNS